MKRTYLKIVSGIAMSALLFLTLAYTPIKEANLSSPKQADKKAPLVSFAVLSDTHFGSKSPEIRVGRSIDAIVNHTPKVDAIFVVGDLTNNGVENQYVDFMSAFKSKVPADVQVFYMMGNHDRYNDRSGALYTKHTAQPFNQSVRIKDFSFITLSVNSTKNSGSECYSDEAHQFLITNIAKAKADFPGKPIFVFGHVPTVNTVWGSSDADNWASDKLEPTLKQYPEAIFFSGHTHFPLRDERSIHQRDFTSVNDGGNDYGELIRGLADGIHPEGSQEVQEVLIVDVDTDLNVTLRKIDTNRGEQIKTPWVVQAPHDKSKFIYTDDRPKPDLATFAKGSRVEVSEVSNASCVITFPQAVNNDVVYCYEVSLVDASQTKLDSDKTIKSVKIYSQYWFGSLTPKTLSWKMLDLEPNKRYSIRVRAEDSFGQFSSSAIVSAPFMTSANKL